MSRRVAVAAPRAVMSPGAKDLRLLQIDAEASVSNDSAFERLLGDQPPVRRQAAVIQTGVHGAYVNGEVIEAK